eukprot:jgi/Ulvmu1/7187/UM034_0096.1
MSKRIAVVATSASELAGEPTGCWAEEIMAPILAFKSAGFDVSVYSVAGGQIPIDEASLNAPFRTEEVDTFLQDDTNKEMIENSQPISSIAGPDEFDAVYIPGGHGACVDLPIDEGLQQFLAAMFEAGKVVSSVCHGPAAFANVKLASGEYMVSGKKVTGFSNSEEAAVGKTEAVPFSLEDKLVEIGGEFSKAEEDWAEYVVGDGNLVTGQNPSSSKAVAQLVVDTLA